MNVIVAVDSHWGIGNKGELLVRIPNDHKFFREETTGKVHRRHRHFMLEHSNGR